jgi:hypothetical protein
MSEHVTRYNLVIRCIDGGVMGHAECSNAGQYVLWQDYQNLLKRLKDEEEANLNLRLNALKDPMIMEAMTEAITEGIKKAVEMGKLKPTDGWKF